MIRQSRTTHATASCVFGVVGPLNQSGATGGGVWVCGVWSCGECPCPGEWPCMWLWKKSLRWPGALTPCAALAARSAAAAAAVGAADCWVVECESCPTSVEGGRGGGDGRASGIGGYGFAACTPVTRWWWLVTGLWLCDDDRGPQSTQSVPRLQAVYLVPGPPSSQTPSEAQLHVFEQVCPTVPRSWRRMNMATGNVVHMVGLMPPSRRVCVARSLSVSRSLSNFTITRNPLLVFSSELAFRAGSFPEMCLYYFSHLLCLYTLLFRGSI